MKKILLVILSATFVLASCGNEPGAESTPIDSTNTYGTSSADYSADNPADDTLPHDADRTGLVDTNTSYGTVDSNAKK